MAMPLSIDLRASLVEIPAELASPDTLTFPTYTCLIGSLNP